MKLYEIVESIQRVLSNDELSSEEQRGALDHLDLTFDARSYFGYGPKEPWV